VSVGSLTQRGALSGGRRAAPAGVAAIPALATVAGLVGVAAVLRFYGLGHQGFWFDEATTAQLVRFSPGKMLGLIPQSESTPPLYYCVAWVWARLFGDHEAGLRSLSALAGVLVVPVAYGAGARLMSRRAGLIAAALTACSPLLVWYSQEARSYSVLVLLTALSLLAFAYVRETPTPRLLTLWVLASGLALATHYFAVITVVP
jgi:mannosyltransferase